MARSSLSQAGFAADVQTLHGCFESDGRHISFDEYRRQDQPISPAVLMLHGSGGLRSHNFPYDELARRLAASGFVVIVPHYLAAPNRCSRNPATKYTKPTKVITPAF